MELLHHFYDSSNICILKDNPVEIEKLGSIPQRACQTLNSIHLAYLLRPADSTSMLVWVVTLFLKSPGGEQILNPEALNIEKLILKYN